MTYACWKGGQQKILLFNYNGVGISGKIMRKKNSKSKLVVTLYLNMFNPQNVDQVTSFSISFAPQKVIAFPYEIIKSESYLFLNKSWTNWNLCRIWHLNTTVIQNKKTKKLAIVFLLDEFLFSDLFLILWIIHFQ